MDRQWVLADRSETGGRFVLGNRPEIGPEDAVVSITLGSGFSLWQFLLNGIASQFVMRQCLKMPGLIYGELASELKSGSSLTLTVWKGGQMREFRVKKAHGWAMRALWWVFYGAKAEAWFLTYKDRQVPSLEEAKQLAERFGKHFKQGKLVRPQRRPDLQSRLSETFAGCPDQQPGVDSGSPTVA